MRRTREKADTLSGELFLSGQIGRIGLLRSCLSDLAIEGVHGEFFFASLGIRVMFWLLLCQVKFQKVLSRWWCLLRQLSLLGRGCLIIRVKRI